LFQSLTYSRIASLSVTGISRSEAGAVSASPGHVDDQMAVGSSGNCPRLGYRRGLSRQNQGVPAIAFSHDCPPVFAFYDVLILVHFSPRQ
jgi:hypothetical protein